MITQSFLDVLITEHNEIEERLADAIKLGSSSDELIRDLRQRALELKNQIAELQQQLGLA